MGQEAPICQSCSMPLRKDEDFGIKAKQMNIPEDKAREMAKKKSKRTKKKS